MVGEFTPWGQIADTAVGVGTGVYQLIKARQLQKQLGERPEYDFNYAKGAVAGQLALAQGEAPGLSQQMTAANQSLANTTQNIASMAPSGAAGLGALVQAGAANQQQQNDILASALQQKLGLQQNYLQGLSNLEANNYQAFDINQMQPYQMKLGEISALKQAGMQNIGGGISNLGQSIDASSMQDQLTSNFNQNTLQAMVDSGLISEDQAKKMGWKGQKSS
jgi:hypothetical protein